jgi:predicted N-formylglutamate amidohydrolase
LLITSEHGGNRVPKAYAHLFRNARSALASHRGYDPGSLSVARLLAKQLEAPLIYSTVTRLLVELNRSIGHRGLFSSFTRELSKEAKQTILDKYYRPYRRQVEQFVSDVVAAGTSVLHVSVHTFTPVLDGQRRTADVGLLYDPSRHGEKQLSRQWSADLKQQLPELRVRRNYPYLGCADGLTTYLRRQFPDDQYAGIELEVNQAWFQSPPTRWRALGKAIAGSLAKRLA